MKPAIKEKPEVIAIIPARGGSKGIPRKNIVDLCGRPLIAYSILAARHAELVDRVVVSTEDEEIAEVAKAWGAEVPFLRPKELAKDTCGIGEAISYTISQLGGANRARVYVQLYPTSPFRTPGFVDQMLSILYRGYASISTVKEISVDPHFLFVQKMPGKKLINVFGKSGGIPSWKKYFRAYSLLLAHSTHESGKHYYHVLTDKCMLIDIDTPQDLSWAEAVISNGLFDFGF